MRLFIRLFPDPGGVCHEMKQVLIVRMGSSLSMSERHRAYRCQTA